MEKRESPIQGGWETFRRLWIATAAANVADGFLLAAVPLLALTLTRDPLLIAGLTAMQYVPWLLFSLPAGVLADLHDRALLLRLANLVRILSLAALALLAGFQLLTLPVLYVGVLVLGLAETSTTTLRPRLCRASSRIVCWSVRTDGCRPPTRWGTRLLGRRWEVCCSAWRSQRRWRSGRWDTQ